MAEPARDFTSDPSAPANNVYNQATAAPDNVIEFPEGSSGSGGSTRTLPTQDPAYVMQSVSRAQRAPLPNTSVNTNNINTISNTQDLQREFRRSTEALKRDTRNYVNNQSRGFMRSKFNQFASPYLSQAGLGNEEQERINQAINDFDTVGAITDPEYRKRAARQAAEYTRAQAKSMAFNYLRESAAGYLDDKAADELRKLGLDDLADIVEQEGISEVMDQVIDALEQGDYSVASNLLRNLGLDFASLWSNRAIMSAQWGTIPTIFTGVGLLAFMAASLISVCSLFRTFLGKRMSDDLFSPYVSRLILTPFIPRYPSPGRIANSLSSLGFFFAMIGVWVLALIIALSIPIIIYVMVAPYIQAASYICSVISISPACVVFN